MRMAIEPAKVFSNALIHAVRNAPSIQILENHRVIGSGARRANGAVAGVFCVPWGSEGGDEPVLIPGRAVVLATGGIGGLYAHTTNPLSAQGGGLALAARAGAVLRDLEFVQFHPTAIAAGRDPMPLATEALRGEGAVLVNSRGERFMQDIPGAELAPRDVVARAIFAQIGAGERVFLDTRARPWRADRQQVPGRDGAVPGRRPRSGSRSNSGAPGRSLPHGRDQGGRSGPQLGRGALGLRRGRLDRPARGEPAGEQLAA